jgi:hypothetical protein
LAETFLKITLNLWMVHLTKGIKLLNKQTIALLVTCVVGNSLKASWISTLELVKSVGSPLNNKNDLHRTVYNIKKLNIIYNYQ